MFSSSFLHSISYKFSKKSPIVDEVSQEKQEIIENGDTENKTFSTGNKKSSDDYRTKFKTEKCKFYEVNKECKFGESVIF